MFKELSGDDRKQRQADTGPAATKLKWKPSASLHDGLQLTIDYFKTILDSR